MIDRGGKAQITNKKQRHLRSKSVIICFLASNGNKKKRQVIKHRSSS